MKVAIKTIRVAVLLAVIAMFVPVMRAQDDSTQSSSQQSQDQGAVPAATAPPETNVENPPLSGLDQPQAEPAFGGRSYLVPVLQFSEGANSNASGTSATSKTVTEVSRVLGSIDLQKIWKRSQLALDEIGGGVFYTGPRFSSLGRNYAVETFSGNERILWRTGQLTFRDSFSYLPEGSFGLNSFGGAGGFGSAMGGGLTGGGVATGVGTGLTGGAGTGVGGVSNYGSVGIQPRISNTAIVDIVQELSPRSSITLAGDYDFTHFLSQSKSSIALLNSQLSSGQVGFNYIISRKDQVGVLYSYQELHFPFSGSSTIKAQVWNGLYGHRITGKLNLVLAGGPQLVSFLGTQTLSGNASALLHYTATARTNAQIQYQHSVSPGSGFFAGANTDAGRVSLNHVFGRRWTGTTDEGYSHHSSVQKNLLTGGINSRSYEYWYAGASLRRQLGQHFGAFVSYQFNEFAAGGCASATPGSICGQHIPQHIGVIGFDWTPRPIRLD